MIHQLPQVLLTYATRRSLWLVLAFGLLCVGPSAALAIVPDHAPGERAPFMMFSIGFATGVVGWILVTQAKWQFCDQRARLLPGFAGPHVAVLLAIAVVGLGLYPWALGAMGGAPLGIVACAIGIGSCFIWSTHGSHWLLGALAIVQYFSLMFHQGREFWTSTRFAPLHAAILVAGWIALVAWLRRLTAMREEDDDFLVPMQAQQGSATRMERSHSGRVVARALVRSAWQRLLSDWWHDRLANIRATTVRGRQWLLRYGFTPTPMEFPAIMMGAMFFIMFYMMSRSGMFSAKGAGVPSYNIMMIMPAMATGGMLAMRRARMSQELLLPLTRRQYIDGVLAAAARSALTGWIPVHGALIALLLATTSALVDAPFVATLTALSLGVQIFTFAVMARSAQNPSGGSRMVMTFASIFPPMIAATAGAAALQAGYPLATWLIALALAAVGLAYLRRVRARWLELELA
jgi:hypothetical protein